MNAAPVKTREQEEAGQRRSAEGLGIVYVPQAREDRPEIAEPICLIWPENLDVFELWCEVWTQWNWATRYTPEGLPMLVRTGLNYPAVIAVAGLRRGRGAVAALLEDLRVIERELLLLLGGA
jgi:hypothetical protein